MKSTDSAVEGCFCCSGKAFASCCEPFLKRKSHPLSPEMLMRSRYSAFCVNDMEFLRETTDAQARYQMDWQATEAWATSAKFLNLEVLRATDEGNKGIVEFKAKFKLADAEEAQVHHELSKFRKQNGRWYYREGKVFDQVASS